jgi:hypothetical protein
MENKIPSLPLTSESLSKISSQPQTNGTARITARSSKSEATISARPTQRTQNEAMDSFRSTMTTSRAHTALAALAAQKHALESRLAIVEAALEAESKKILVKGLKSSNKLNSSTKKSESK